MAKGASKFIAITVEGGKTVIDCKKIAYAIAHSPLVKTAFFASDPNLGRILAAIDYANVDFDLNALSLYLDDVLVAKKGAIRQLSRSGRAVCFSKKRYRNSRGTRGRGSQNHRLDL